MTISFIIPVYNGEKYIERCISSCLLQVDDDLGVEVIVIDDGSTDDTRSIVQRYSENSKSVKLFTQKNRGVSAARNKGLGYSTAEYVMFVDADDYLTPKSVGSLIEKMKLKSIEILAHGAIVEDENGERIDKICEIESKIDKLKIYKGIDFIKINEGPYKRSEVSGAWGFVIDRNFLASSGVKFKEGLPFGEDSLFFIDLILKTDRIAFSQEKIYHYVQQPASVMHKVHSIETIHKATLMRCVENRRILEDNRGEIDDEVRDIIEGRLISIAFSRLFLRLLRNGNETYYASTAIQEFRKNGLWALPPLPPSHSPYVGKKAIMYRLITIPNIYKILIQIKRLISR